MKSLSPSIPNDVCTEWLSCFPSKCTKRAYWHDLCLFSNWMETNNLTIATIRLSHLQAWKKTTTVNSASRRLIASVKSFWKHCYQQDIIEKDIGKCLKIPVRQPVRIERKLTRNQIDRMLAIASGDTKIYLNILFFGGLRTSECRLLHRRNIKVRNDGCLTLNVLGKRSKWRRVVLPKNVSKLLAPILDREGFIFKCRTGVLSSSGASKRIAKVMKAVVPAASAHWMRHSFASLALHAGADLTTVSKTLGHASISTTSVYLHSNDSSVGRFLE